MLIEESTNHRCIGRLDELPSYVERVPGRPRRHRRVTKYRCTGCGDIVRVEYTSP